MHGLKSSVNKALRGKVHRKGLLRVVVMDNGEVMSVIDEPDFDLDWIVSSWYYTSKQAVYNELKEKLEEQSRVSDIPKKYWY